MEPGGRAMVGTVIVNQGEVVRPSQLIASVRRTVGKRDALGGGQLGGRNNSGGEGDESYLRLFGRHAG